jgi:hypothetical protein
MAMQQCMSRHVNITCVMTTCDGQGHDCMDTFMAMQQCMSRHPEAFADFVQPREESDAHEDAVEEVASVVATLPPPTPSPAQQVPSQQSSTVGTPPPAQQAPSQQSSTVGTLHFPPPDIL